MKIAIILSLLSVSTFAFSNEPLTIPRSQVKSMTCDEVQALVKDNGTVVFTYRFLGIPTYDYSSFETTKCLIAPGHHETLVGLYLKTKDNRKCYVGNYCHLTTSSFDSFRDDG